MHDMMPKKEFDITHITLMLLKMRDNCAIRREGEAYNDPLRNEKYEALNDAITLINNPSLLGNPKQQPLTLEEIKAGDTLYIEIIGEDKLEPVLISKYSLSPNFIGYERLGWASRFNIDKTSCGRSWRCWAYKPTEEEREAAAWES